MKTKKIISVNRYMIITFLFLSWISGLYSQQIIKFKNGKEQKCFIVYQTKDTLEYQTPSESYVTRIVSMDKVDTIMNIALDTTVNLKKDKTYLHYQHITTTGIVLASTGAAISLLGIIIMGSAKHTHDDFWGDTYDATVVVGSGVTCLGAALLLPGAIVAAINSSKMKKYENKLRGFSFDMKYTRELKGISVVYHF